MLRFETEFRLNADAPPEEIAARLSQLTAPPFSLSKVNRRKILRGRIAPAKSYVRWPRNEYRIASFRNLFFSILPAPHGATLVGKFVLSHPLRWVALGWVALANTFWVSQLTYHLFHHPQWSRIGTDLFFLALPWFMASAYLWFGVAFGKRRDRSLVRTLRVVLASQAGADILNEILSPTDNPRQSFLDTLPQIDPP